MFSQASQGSGLPAPWHSLSFISIHHGCKVNPRPSWAFLEAPTAGPFQGNKDTQTKVGSLAGCWKSEGELATGRLWVRHSAPGSGMSRAKYVGSLWGAGAGWTAGCDWSVSTLPGEKFWKPGLGHAPVKQCSCLSRCISVCWVACSGQIQEYGIWVV